MKASEAHAIAAASQKESAEFKLAYERIIGEIKAAAGEGRTECESHLNANGAANVIIRDRIIKTLRDEGYDVRSKYFPGEAGRKSYDEQDIPPCYNLTISW